MPQPLAAARTVRTAQLDRIDLGERSGERIAHRAERERQPDARGRHGRHVPPRDDGPSPSPPERARRLVSVETMVEATAAPSG